MQWTTACPDWEQRILSRESLVPCPPLFPAEAEAALKIFRALKIVDAIDSPSMGDACREWVFDFVAAIFGAYDASTGRRLINEFLLLISKKNAKSTTAAGIMITALLRNWRKSAEFIILAPSLKVANNSAEPAMDMVAEDPELKKILKPIAHQRRIEHRTTGGALQIVAADSEVVSGGKAVGVLIDELWLFGKMAKAKNMLREAVGGLASRPEGFVIALTTHSDEAPAGVWKEWLSRYRKIRDGAIRAPRSLGVLYEFPESMLKEEAYKDPSNWYVTNPNLGLSVDEQFLRDEFDKAALEGQKSLVGFYAKHLNVEMSINLGVASWAGTAVWERGIEVGLTLDKLLDRSEVVTIGIDGGGLDDLLGIGIIGRERGTKRWLGWGHALISDIGIERRKANIVHYDQFEKEESLTKFSYSPPSPDADPSKIFPKNIQYVVDLVKKVLDRGLLAQVGVDAAGIGAIVDALGGIGVTQDAEKLGAIRQGVALMGAIKTIETKLADYSFHHGGSEMMKWCVGNLRVKQTSTAMMVARDESGFGKVDPAMALFNASALMCLNPDGESVYSTAERPDGLLIIGAA